MKNKEIVHYTASYLIDPQHPVTVNVIGCGGTGSQAINTLARMNYALKALGHPGLFVRAIDPDKVTEANQGRQLFSPADIETYKCIALIGKINRFFGNDWEAVPLLYNAGCTIPSANITISCVDTGAARKEIKANLVARSMRMEHFHRPYYWIDFGNMMDRGQVVIGTINPIEQPKDSKYTCRAILPTVDKLHPEIFKDKKNDDQGPSCSLAEALGKQDLLINTNLANQGLDILWKMFRNAKVDHHGLYLNQSSVNLNPIKIK